MSHTPTDRATDATPALDFLTDLRPFGSWPRKNGLLPGNPVGPDDEDVYGVGRELCSTSAVPRSSGDLGWRTLPLEIIALGRWRGFVGMERRILGAERRPKQEFRTQRLSLTGGSFS
jgi:hypothetical protein